MIELTMTAIKPVDAAKYLYFSPVVPDADQIPLVSYTSLRQQRGNDLGQKMLHAFEEVLLDYRKVLIVGTDCPYLTPRLLSDAFKRLDHFDMVIGPAKDGGYYLLGLKKINPALFTDMPWGTDQIFRRTLQRAILLGLSVHALIELNDVDYEKDWLEYLAGLT